MARTVTWCCVQTDGTHKEIIGTNWDRMSLHWGTTHGQDYQGPCRNKVKGEDDGEKEGEEGLYDDHAARGDA